MVLAERYGPSRMPQILVSDTIRAVRNAASGMPISTSARPYGGDPRRRRSGDAFPEPAGFRTLCRVPGVRLDGPLSSCNVTLTLHKGSGRMVCHYCGHTEPVPAKCPHCRVTEPVPMGFGTEKVEEEIARVFPEARVAARPRQRYLRACFPADRRGLRPGRC